MALARKSRIVQTLVLDIWPSVSLFLLLLQLRRKILRKHNNSPLGQFFDRLWYINKKHNCRLVWYSLKEEIGMKICVSHYPGLLKGVLMSALNNSTDITYNYIRYRRENRTHHSDEQPAFPLSLSWKSTWKHDPGTERLL